MSDVINLTITPNVEQIGIQQSEVKPITVNFFERAQPDSSVIENREAAQAAAAEALTSQNAAAASAADASSAAQAVWDTKSTTDLPEGDQLYYTQERFDDAFSNKLTDELNEGSTNLYYTDARFDARLAAKSTSNLGEGSNLYYTQARFDTAFTAKSTSNLTEGSNLYHTTARARSAAVVNSTSGTETDQAPSVDSIKAYIAAQIAAVGGIPTGSMMDYGGTTAPTGWLICDGSTVSRTTYAALFTAIGTAWGSGNGSTTFHLPDMRGRFARGADNMGTGAAGRDPDAASRTASNAGGATGNNIATVQGHAIQGHAHNFIAYTGSEVSSIAYYQSDSGNIGMGIAGTSAQGTSFSVAGVRDYANGTVTVSNETRPANAAVMIIIKT